MASSRPRPREATTDLRYISTAIHNHALLFQKQLFSPVDLLKVFDSLPRYSWSPPAVYSFLLYFVLRFFAGRPVLRGGPSTHFWRQWSRLWYLLVQLLLVVVG